MQIIRQTRVTRVQRVPVIIQGTAQPVDRRKARGFHPSTHNFFIRLMGAACTALVVIAGLFALASQQ